MQLGGDQRGQSIQIGAIILFGALIILLSTYQAFVVPNQNQEVEFKHNQQVQDDMRELRGALISASDGKRSSVSVQLGTEYPSRAIFVNPGPPSGALRTVGTTDVSVNAAIQNASASGDIGDFWNGTTHNYSTGDIVYSPNYNVYQNAPTTQYTNTVLYNQFEDENLTLTDQTLVDGKSITLVTLNGSMSMGRAGSTSVDVRPVSASSNRVTVTNASDGENVTLALATRLSESKWKSLLEAERVENGGHVYNVTVDQMSDSNFDRLLVRLEPDVIYKLKMARVGVGSRVGQSPPAAYLVKTRGNGTVVPEGQTTTLEVEVRDRYNNPVSGREINASTSRGDSAVSGIDDTGSDGIVEFRYEAPGNIDGGAINDSINVSIDESVATAGQGFNTSAPANVSFEVSVDNTDGSGTTADGSAYTIAFDTGKIGSEVGMDCTNGNCEYDFGSDKSDSAFTLTAETLNETIIGADVDFALNTTDRGRYSSEEKTTDRNGEATTVFDANNTGVIKSFVSSGGSSDRLRITLTDTSKVISALDNNPTGDDSKYEFVRLYFAEATNTGGWTLEDDDDNSEITTLPSEELSGEVYFAANGTEFAERWGISQDRVYNMSTVLENTRKPLWLNDSSGNVIDKVEYDVNSEDGTDGIINMGNASDVGVRKFLGGTYPYQDTNDNDADWQKKDEADVLGTVSGGGFQSRSVADLVPSTSGQRQTFTFTPDTDILSGEKVVINLSEPQKTSPRQVDYQGGVASVNTGSAGLNKQNSEVAYLNWTASGDLSAGTTVEIVVDDVKTGPDVNQNSSYNVDITRQDTGVTTVAAFEVGRSTGGSELTNVKMTSLSQSSSGQEQELVFEPATELASDQVVQVDLSEAASTSDVDYSSASPSVNRSENDLSFTDQNIDNASIRYQPGSDLAAGTPVKITITSIGTDSMTNAPYTIGVGRSDAGTTSTTFGVKDPANFQVTIDDTNSPVIEEETLSVNATVDNTGGTTDSQTIRLFYDSTGDGNANTEADSQTVSNLAPGDSPQSVTLNWATTSGDAGNNINIEVTSDNDSDTDQVTVTGGPLFYNGGMTAVNDGDDASADAIEFTMENIGTSDITITEVTVDSTNSSATQIVQPSNNCNQAGSRFEAGLWVVADSQNGCVADNTVYTIGTDPFTLGQGNNQEAILTSSETDATFTIHEFRDSNDNSVSMSGANVVVTITYDYGGVEYTVTIDDTA